MDFSTLYYMSGGLMYGALDVCPRDDIADDLALMKAESLPSEPIVFEYLCGGRPQDVIGTGHAILELFSDRIIDVFRNEGFTGWTTYPVEIYGKKGERIEGYHGFAVTGRCGLVDESRSREVIVPPPVPEGRARRTSRGLYFDPDTWDGSDIFTPQGGWVFVLESVKKALERAKVKNIYFERLTEYLWP